VPIRRSIFAHATGFHGRLWDYIIRRLPGRRCLAVETRGHGRSARPDPPYRWRYLGQDLAGLLRILGLRGAFGIGHSSGGHSMVQAAALVPEAFAAMLLIDPTLFPLISLRQRPARLRLHPAPQERVANSAEEMIERFRGRAPFVTWVPEILRDYCCYGLLPNGDHLSLACPPAVEASIYEQAAAPESNIYAEVAQVTAPVTVLRAGVARKPGELDLAASPTAVDLASRFARGREVVLEGASHFIPMEFPDRVIEEVRGIARI
jgi:lipase